MPAQITLFLDETGTLHCEAPGKNGMREKIEISKDDISPAILWRLREMQEKELENKLEEVRRQDRLAKERHQRITTYMMAHHPNQVHLVDPGVQVTKSGFFSRPKNIDTSGGIKRSKEELHAAQAARVTI
jgi:hypothetical protein